MRAAHAVSPGRTRPPVPAYPAYRCGRPRTDPSQRHLRTGLRESPDWRRTSLAARREQRHAPLRTAHEASLN
jgi:hypothetical protein